MIPRRTFLADMGMGVTGMALGAMLADDGVVRGAEQGVSTLTGLFPALNRSFGFFSPVATVTWRLLIPSRT